PGDGRRAGAPGAAGVGTTPVDRRGRFPVPGSRGRPRGLAARLLGPGALHPMDSDLTPLDRLRLPLTAGRRNVVLVFNGSFCPVHAGHLRMMELARQHLEGSLGWNVAGGYLMITHDSACRRKLGEQACPAVHRARMCELAVADSGWLMVDRFQ